MRQNIVSLDPPFSFRSICNQFARTGIRVLHPREWAMVSTRYAVQNKHETNGLENETLFHMHEIKNIKTEKVFTHCSGDKCGSHIHLTCKRR
jgi:hypothetical protein